MRDEAPREIELKLELEPSGVKRFRTEVLPAFAPDGAETRRLVSTYFDTRKRALAKSGLSLRVRRDGDRRVQTLKADGGAAAGLHDRPEWESEVAGDEPELAGLGEEARRLAGAPGGLAKVFETAVDRTAWTLEADGSAIEIALDDGAVTAGDAAQPIAEVEIELKRGVPADLFRLARSLGEAAPVRLGVVTKSERGYALADGPAAAGIKAEPIALDASAGVGEAFARIARACLRHFRLNEPALVERRAPEALHQARVALRRLRSAFSLFKPLVGDPEGRRIASELRNASRLLGDARNLDVLLARLGPEDGDARGRLGPERERAYGRALKLLGSKRFRLLTLDLAAYVETGPWRADPALAALRDGSVAPFAAVALDRRRDKVVEAGRKLKRLSPEERHAVRIEGKKLRYASEFFAGLVEGRKGRRRHKKTLAALEELQESLGALNDLATEREMTAGLTVSADGGFAPRPAAPEGDGERETELLARAIAARRALKRAKPFWTW